MQLSPTSISLFVVQILTFFAVLIVAICCGLYVSAYPHSPEAGSLSPIALGTFAFSIISLLMTIFLALRHKSGKTVRTIIESAWVLFATALWALAGVGAIIRPPNNMSHISCKVLPSGKDTDDKNYTRACQAMFASTAFCLVSALLFGAMAVLLMVFSVRRSVQDRKKRGKQVGGTYALSMTPSQYRRAEEDSEEGKNLKGAGEHEEEEEPKPYKDAKEDEEKQQQHEERFSDRVYQDPVISPMPTSLPASYQIQQQQQQQQHHLYLQQQQQQQQQMQQQQQWAQQPAYGY
ncbi:hypothetical protein EMPS_10844 [Entomortierella parvispora]|uniref:MARVEL domain-containing protein n=1 Tax=Entomortierella parvispora TaxID=205924 RepID=A0A9P3HKY4_9FUNG|nr:hypothetical protein EMPS_10844 [Entomortierella parvispora]